MTRVSLMLDEEEERKAYREYHFMPKASDGQHVTARTCWCEPIIKNCEDGDKLVIHVGGAEALQ